MAECRNRRAIAERRSGLYFLGVDDAVVNTLGVAMRKDVWRALTEIAFIIFLFYSNLLIGEYT